MTPKVSVVTTVYNGEPYVDRAIPGILGQTFEDFEWILVDDGSRTAHPRSSMTSPAVTPAFGSSRPAAWASRRPRTTESPRPGASMSRGRTSTTAVIPTGCGCRRHFWMLTRKWGSWADTTSSWMKTGVNAMSGCRPVSMGPSSRRWPRASRLRTPSSPFAGRRGPRQVATPRSPISRICCSGQDSQPWLALRLDSGAAGRALRSSRQLLSPLVQVRRSAAGTRAGAGARRPRARTPELDASVRAGAVYLCLLPCGAEASVAPHTGGISGARLLNADGQSVRAQGGDSEG